LKDIFILGGPNGAGKTTAARVLLPEFLREREFLNADEIGGIDPLKMTSRKLLDSVDRALDQVERRLKSGELDGSGRFYSDDQLARGAASSDVKNRHPKKPEPKAEEPAA
jgi:hypothetical protein